MTGKPKRDAALTKKRILEAAASKFSEKGYEATGTREIGELAEANISLLNRYFGSKQELFEQSIIPQLTLDPMLDGEFEKTPERLAQHMAGKSDAGPMEVDPFQAILRSMGSEAVGPSIRQALSSQVISRVAAQMEGDHTQVRAALMTAVLFGVDAIFRVMELGLQEAEDKDALETLVEDILTTILLPKNET